MAESFQQLTIKKKANVEIGASLLVVDSLPLDQFCALDYFLCFKKDGLNSTKAFKVLVRKTETNVEDSVYSRNGTGIDVDFFVNVNGSNVELQVTNNEAVAVELTFARTKL
jgi:hypothetical protein